MLAWTIDSQGGGKRIVHARARRRDRAFCGTCHTLSPDDRGPALLGSRASSRARTRSSRRSTAPTVSSHGGRMENSLRSSVECVPEVAAGVAGRAPILVDGGFRRGTDIFKALALGATAVGVGRPYIFGLAAFGQPGVETALDILDSVMLRAPRTPPRSGPRRRAPRRRRPPPDASAEAMYASARARSLTWITGIPPSD